MIVASITIVDSVTQAFPRLFILDSIPNVGDTVCFSVDSELEKTRYLAKAHAVKHQFGKLYNVDVSNLQRTTTDLPS